MDKNPAKALRKIADDLRRFDRFQNDVSPWLTSPEFDRHLEESFDSIKQDEQRRRKERAERPFRPGDRVRSTMTHTFGTVIGPSRSHHIDGHIDVEWDGYGKQSVSPLYIDPIN